MKLTLNVFGKRSVGCPLRTTWSPKASCTRFQKRSRSCRADSMPSHGWAISHAAPGLHRAEYFRSQRDGPFRGLHRGSVVPTGLFAHQECTDSLRSVKLVAYDG